MHIVHVNLARGYRGGERQTQLLIQGLSAAGGHEQTLVCRPDSPLHDELNGISGLCFCPARHMLGGHRRFAPDSLVHAHDGKAAHWAFLQRLTHRTPYIITRRVPNPLNTDPWTKSVYAGAKRLVAISTPIQKYLQSYLSHPPPVDRIPSAWTPRTADREATASLRRAYAPYFIIGHVGALSDRHKGQRHLIEAARRLEKSYPQMRFLFLGSGPDRKMLEGMAEGLNNVDFLGFQNDVGLYLSIMDLFVFPSNYEGLGSTLLDAIGCGVPIIASAVGGIPDIIQDGVNGVLIPPGNPQAITEAIVHLYHRPGLRRSLAHQAAARLDEFSPARMVHSYEHLYRSLNPQL